MSATSPLLLVAVAGFPVAFSFASPCSFLSSVIRRRRRRFGRLLHRFLLLRKLAPAKVESRPPHETYATLCLKATIRIALGSYTLCQLLGSASSALVGNAPLTLASVHFTPRGCKMKTRRLMR